MLATVIVDGTRFRSDRLVLQLLAVDRMPDAKKMVAPQFRRGQEFQDLSGP